MDLKTATPVEVDTVLYRLYREEGTAKHDVGVAHDSLHYAAGDKRERSKYAGLPMWKMTTEEALAAATEIAKGKYYDATQAQKAISQYNDAVVALDKVRDAMKPLNAEFRRRPWTRAFLVQNAGGHVHSSMSCSTCFPTTWYAWMVDYSGKDETEIVEAAGEAACTICYPSAPVDVLKRPTRMFGPDQIAAQAARDERAAAKAVRDAKKIAKGLTPDGSEFVVTYTEQHAPGWERDRDGKQVHVYRDRTRNEFFKTEQSAVQWVVQYALWNGWEDDKAEGFRQVIEAVATKHGKSVEQVTEEIKAKMVAKAKRDSRGY